MSDDKTALREHARDLRARLQPTLDEAEEASRLFFETLQPRSGQVVAAYWPKGKEFDARVIIDECLKRSIDVALPVIPKDSRILQFRLWRDGDELNTGAFHTLEPAGGESVWPDIVIVPFLAFDRRGHRLGYGGGYYDATLADLRARKQIIAAGVGYAEQAVLFNLPSGPHDQPLDLIITPKGVFDYR